MSTRRGVLTQLGSTHARITLDESATCGSCKLASGCGNAFLNRDAVAEIELDTKRLNFQNMAEGDELSLSISPQTIMTNALVLYLAPILSMFVSIILVNQIISTDLVIREAIVAFTGFFGLCIGGLLSQRVLSGRSFSCDIKVQKAPAVS